MYRLLASDGVTSGDGGISLAVIEWLPICAESEKMTKNPTNIKKIETLRDLEYISFRILFLKEFRRVLRTDIFISPAFQIVFWTCFLGLENERCSEIFPTLGATQAKLYDKIALNNVLVMKY